MSKFTKIMITLLVIAGFILPAVAMAEERLSLSGYYNLRGYSKDNADFDDDKGDSTQYFYQRLRIGGTIAAAEGVSVHFRADIAEGTTATAKAAATDGGWDGSEGGAGANSIGNIQFDNAYVKIAKDVYTLQVGQFGGGFGNAMILDMTRTTAVKFTLNDINLAVAYHKLYEGDSAYSDDADLFLVTWGMASDAFSLDLLGGYAKWGGTLPANVTDDIANVDVYMAGAAAKFNLGVFKLNTEIDFLTGTTESNIATAADIDLKGLQAYVDGSLALGENFTLGGALVYAQGYDSATEEQITGVGYDFEPEEYGYMKTIMGGAYPGNALDPAGQGTGVISGQLYAGFQLSDDLGLKASVSYAEPETDTADVDYNSFLVAGVSARYKLAANTNIDVQYLYEQPDAKAGIADDTKMIAACRLAVSF